MIRIANGHNETFYISNMCFVITNEGEKSANLVYPIILHMPYQGWQRFFLWYPSCWARRCRQWRTGFWPGLPWCLSADLPRSWTCQQTMKEKRLLVAMIILSTDNIVINAKYIGGNNNIAGCNVEWRNLSEDHETLFQFVRIYNSEVTKQLWHNIVRLSCRELT